MSLEAWYGILIPFWGRPWARPVYFDEKSHGRPSAAGVNRLAAGVMVAASIWSLLLPAMEQAESMGKWSFVPAAAGFWLGIAFLLLLDHLIPPFAPKLCRC